MTRRSASAKNLQSQSSSRKRLHGNLKIGFRIEINCINNKNATLECELKRCGMGAFAVAQFSGCG